MSRGKKGLTPIGDLISPKLIREIKGPTPIQQRLIEAAAFVETNDETQKLYQHTVLCQTSLPYRDPGDEIREWERLNGDVHLEVIAGKAMHPEQGKLVPVGLPFGPKCRLVLMYINQKAIATQSPAIEMDESLSAFVRRVLKLDPKGRNIRVVKDQLARLAASSIRFGVVRDGHAVTVNSHIVTQFDIWFPKDERQRVLWPSSVHLSLDYFQSLLIHGVPLNEAHIAALSHSALALDIYAWLAQRLHRIPANKPAFISWAALHGQFGQGYTGDQSVKKFRANFKTALKQVLALYKTARIEEDERKPPRLFLQAGKPAWREQPAKGLTLHNSPPPIAPRLHVVS
jgi:Plasmid encoded RepA protein